jgi:hypothetical protein
MISDKGEKVMTEIRTTYLFTIALTLDEIQLLGKRLSASDVSP